MKKIYILNQFEQQDHEIIKVNPINLLNGGIHLLKTYKDTHPDAQVFLDTKINDFDFRTIENENIAMADIVSVNGTSTDSTIRYVLRIAKENGKDVIVDLSGSDCLNDRILDMDIIGIDYVAIDNEDFIKL